MNTGKTAVALTGGYLLGRFHKARWALALAGAVAGRRLSARGGGMGGALLSSPEVGRLTENVRGDLAAAGRAAAVAAASHRMDALSGRMADWSSSLRAGAGTDAGHEDQGDQEDQEHRAEDEEGEDREEREERGGGRPAASRRGGASREADRGAGDRPKAKRAAAADRGPAKKKATGARAGEGTRKTATGGGGKSRGQTGRSAREAGSATRSGGREHKGS